MHDLSDLQMGKMGALKQYTDQKDALQLNPGVLGETHELNY